MGWLCRAEAVDVEVLGRWKLRPLWSDDLLLILIEAIVLVDTAALKIENVAKFVVL